MFRVRVYDGQLTRQIERRVAGEAAARSVEANLLADVKVPLAARQRTPEVVSAGARSGALVVANPATLTVRQWSLQYLELFALRRDGTLRPRSSWQKDNAVLSRYVLPFLGDRSLVQVRLHELDDLVAGTVKMDGSPVAGATKEMVAGTLKRVWKMAERRGILEHNTAAGLSSAWGGQSETRRAIIPSVADVEALAGALDAVTPGHGDIVRLISYTGMRWEEVAAVTVEDIDWQQKSINVHRTATSSGGRRAASEELKTSAGRRHVPIPPQLSPGLRRLVRLGDARRAQHGWNGERFIVTGKRGGWLSYSLWRIHLERAQKASGVSYTAHALRHVAASLAIASGMDEVDVAQMMGHANIAFTRRVYGHIFPKDRRAVAEKMGLAIKAPSGASSGCHSHGGEDRAPTSHVGHPHTQK